MERVASDENEVGDDVDAKKECDGDVDASQIVVMSDEAKAERVMKFVAEYHNKLLKEIVNIYYDSEKSLLYLAVATTQKHSDVIVTGTGRSVIWLGRVLIFHYKETVDTWKEQLLKNKANAVHKCVSEVGKMFDMGATVSFLNDGVHLINYKLQIVDFRQGLVVREIAPSEEQLCFILLKVTHDFQFIVGQVYFPSYEVNFAVDLDDKSNHSNTFAINPPRAIQAYRISDGKRLGNYLFEFDPSGFGLCGKEGRDVVLFIHNSPVMIFHLFDPPSSNLALSSVEEKEAEVNRGEISLKDAPGPKPEYLKKIAPALALAMADVVNLRPADPIVFLSNFLFDYADKLS